MIKKWNWRLKATAIAAITAGGMLLGGPVTAMAAPDDTTENVEETQDTSAQEEGATEAATATDEVGSDTSDDAAGNQQETEAASEETDKSADEQQESESANDTTDEAAGDQQESEAATEQSDEAVSGGEVNEAAADGQEPQDKVLSSVQNADEQTAKEPVAANALETTKNPLDFAADPTSRSGDKWSWDRDTATLTLNGFYLDLLEYEDDFKAAITFPEDAETVTIVHSGTSLIQYTGSNKDGSHQTGIYCPGNLVITGDGLFQVAPNNPSPGVFAGGNLTIDGTGKGTKKFEFHNENKGDYAFSAEKDLKISSTVIHTGIQSAVNGIRNSAFYAGAGVDISDSEIHSTTYNGSVANVFHAGDGEGEISIKNTVLFQNTNISSFSSVIVNDNGDVIIDGGKMRMTTYGNETNPTALISSSNGNVQISSTQINGVGHRAILAPDGNVSILDGSNISIVTTDKCTDAGDAGLTVTDSYLSLKSNGGSYAVSSSGPVSLENSQIYFEAETDNSCGLKTNGQISISGELAYVDLSGKMAAMEIITNTGTADMPLALNGVSLISPSAATQQYADTATDRFFSYSESTLAIEGDELKNASENLLFADENGLFIMEQPKDASVNYPDKAEFEVKVNKPENIKSYQWVLENTDGGYQTFYLENTDDPKLVIPSTESNNRDWYFYCLITDNDGNTLETRRAALELKNRDEIKPVLYAGWNALEPGDSLDLSTAHLGSGTVSFDSDGKTIIFDNVHFTNDDEGSIWWDRIIPTYGIRLLKKNAGNDQEYNLILKGDNIIESTYMQEGTSMTGIPLDFEFYSSGGTESRTPVVHVYKDDSSGGSLTIKGGETQFRVIGDLDLNTDITLANFEEGPLAKRYRLGIDCMGFNLASGCVADLNVNGIALSTGIGSVTIDDGAMVKINMTPMSTGQGLVVPAMYISSHNLEIGADAVVDITAHATPAQGLTIEYMGGIYLANGAAMTVDGPDTEINIRMSADPSDKVYVSEITGILGSEAKGDNSNININKAKVAVDIDGTNATGAAGIYTPGNVTLKDSYIPINVSAIQSANGLTPEGDLNITDSGVFATTKYVGSSGTSYAIAANTVNVDFSKTSYVVKGNATNPGGIGLQSKAGGGDTPQHYDPSYEAKYIVLSGLAKCIEPEDNAISLISRPSATGDPRFVYFETYFDKNDTTKPANEVVINTVERPIVVTFDANGGDQESAPEKMNVKSAEEFSIPDTIPTRDAQHEFIGWSTDIKAAEAQYKPGDKVTFDTDTTLFAVWKANYSVTEGDGAVWTKDSGKVLTFVSDGNFDLFKVLQIDGESVREGVKVYASVDGGTVAEISADVLQKLSAGQHTVTFAFADGEVSAIFTVQDADNPTPEPAPTPDPGGYTPSGGSVVPGTGDANYTPVWIALAGAAAAAAVTVVVIRRKKDNT